MFKNQGKPGRYLKHFANVLTFELQNLAFCPFIWLENYIIHVLLFGLIEWHYNETPLYLMDKVFETYAETILLDLILQITQIIRPKFPSTIQQNSYQKAVILDKTCI